MELALVKKTGSAQQMYISSLRHFVFAFLAALVVATCGDYNRNSSTAAYPLDYLRLYDAAGWLLHIEGDGSGYLQHRAVAGRKIAFPMDSFHFLPLPAHFNRCGRKTATLSSPQCPKAVYFSEQENQKTTCYCPQEDWMNALFRQAYRWMESEEKKAIDCRVLERKWLQQPPLGRKDDK